MKDYSNYYSHSNDFLLSSLKTIFQKRLNSLEGKDISIDGVPCRVVLLEHTNPLNEDKEDRKMLIPNTISIHTGSKVTIGTEVWMIINKISPLDDNGVYCAVKIYPCNFNLKYICPVDKITIHEIYAIKSNMSLYSIGTEENKYFVTEDGKRFITIPLNDDTKEIYVGQRFMIDDDVFKVTELYRDNGTLEIKMAQTDKMVGKDNINGNGIAYNDGINIITLPTTPNYSIQIIGDNDVQVNYCKTYQAKVYNNGLETTDTVIWSIDSPTNSSITPSGNSCEFKGLVEGEYVILTAKLQKDSNITVNKEIYVRGAW